MYHVDSLNEKPSCSSGDTDTVKGFVPSTLIWQLYALFPSFFVIGASGDIVVPSTSALEAVRQQSGMMAVRLQGKMYDMGNPKALRNCVAGFAVVNSEQ